MSFDQSGASDWVLLGPNRIWMENEHAIAIGRSILIRPLLRLRYHVLTLDLLDILAYRSIDFGNLHKLIAGDRTVRARICADLRRSTDKSAPFKSPTSIHC
jgi:hypothetical protein